MDLSFRPKQSSQTGGVIAEFAIVLPLAMLLIQAVLSFGLGYREYAVVADAVRSAARVAAANRTAASPCSIANNNFIKSIQDYGLNTTGYTLSYGKFRKEITATDSDEWYLVLTATRTGGTLFGFITDWTFPKQVRTMFMFEEESQNTDGCLTEVL